MDQQAIDAIRESDATLITNKAIIDAHANLTPVIAAPGSIKVIDMEGFMPGRRRARGKMVTTVLQSFVDYTKANADSCSVFLSEEIMHAVAILNFGNPSVPGHTDDQVIFAPPRTAAFKDMLALADRGMVTQTIMAQFLEDWMDGIECFRDEATVPVAAAIKAIRNLSIDQIKKTDSSEEKLSASASMFEQLSADKNAHLPTEIALTFKPYRDLNEREFRMRVGISVDDAGKPRLTVKLRNTERLNEEMASELSDKVTVAMRSDGIDGVPIYIGAYAAGK